MYERDDTPQWNIFDGDFQVAGSGAGSNLIDQDGATLLEQTFDNLANGNSQALGTQYALVLTSDTHQDMIVGDPPAPVPEPSTIALLFSGLILMGGTYWRQSKQTA